MQDKEFLGYFQSLGSNTVDDIKRASQNIVMTLLVPNRAEHDVSNHEQLITLQKKYCTGDLGDQMDADLNYTLKRLIGGLISENHQVKRGFFFAMSQVLQRFKKQIDPMKFLKYVTEETKTTKTMK